MSAVVENGLHIGETTQRALPVVELFGPTVQGEGPDAGRPAYFIRFGGCDYRCSWCDSMHAVEPRLVQKAERLAPREIVARLSGLPLGPRLVVLSGGNPALLQLGELVDHLHEAGYDVAVETQGSRWSSWLANVDRLIVSPKPPSSAMAGPKQTGRFAEFMAAAIRAADPVLKVVIFDEVDLNWAEAVHANYREMPFYLSVGSDVGLDDEATLDGLRARFRWLASAVASRPELAEARVLPQLHVVAWGTKQGV